MRGRFLDASEFWPIYEVAEGLDVPLFVHPTTPAWVCQIADNQRSAVGVLISAGWLGRRELPDQRTPAREEESSLDGERDVSFAAMSDSEILSQRIEGGTEA